MPAAPPSSIVVIGGSSGALEPLRSIVAGLGPKLDAAFFVALHTSPNSPGVVDKILGRLNRMPSRYAHQHERIQPSHLYIAPPDRHLLVRPTTMLVTAGPRENRFRPAIDPLFRTAARAWGPRVIGVLLSGGQDDGVIGLSVIKSLGGTTVVQDPDEASCPILPEAALRDITIDHVVFAKDMPALLSNLIEARRPKETPMSEQPPHDIAEGGAHDIHRASELGAPAPLTCPDCGGTLWQSPEGELLQFQCHLGHRYSSTGLEHAQDEALDRALWTALRTLEEGSELRRRLARNARARRLAAIADSIDARAADLEDHAFTIRRILMPEAPETADHTEPQPGRGEAKT